MEFEIHPKIYNYFTDKNVVYSKLDSELTELINKNMTSPGYAKFLLKIINENAQPDVTSVEQYIQFKNMKITSLGDLKFKCSVDYKILDEPKDKFLEFKDDLLDVESVKLSELKNYVKEAVNHHYQSTDPYKIYLKSGKKYVARKGSNYNFDKDSYSEILHMNNLKKFKLV